MRMGGKEAPQRLKSIRADANRNTEVVREKVQDGLTGETREMQYTQCKIVGNGSFGVVFQTKLAPNGEDAAIKRVLQDKRFKVNMNDEYMLVPGANVIQNRELQIMRIVRHPNIVELKAFYYSNGERVSSRARYNNTRNIKDQSPDLCVERRSLPQSCVGIRSGNRLPCLALLQQNQNHHADIGDQNLHISAFPLTRIHPFPRNMP